MKAKIVTASALFLAGLGALASVNQGPQRSEPAPAETLEVRSEGQPVETPLVAKLLVKEKPPLGTEHIIGDKDFLIAKGGSIYIDGTPTKDGFFKYEAARNIFVPVDHGHPRYLHNKGRVGLEHLIAEHGHARSSAEKWTQEELEIAHANSHWWEKTHHTPAPPLPPKSGTRSQGGFSSSCPNGQCGNPSRSRGLFRRR